jgi:glycine dehydrogenase subunit 1
VEAALGAAGVLSGLPIESGMLWCVTEKASTSELFRVAQLVREACQQ